MLWRGGDLCVDILESTHPVYIHCLRHFSRRDLNSHSSVVSGAVNTCTSWLHTQLASQAALELVAKFYWLRLPVGQDDVSQRRSTSRTYLSYYYLASHAG